MPARRACRRLAVIAAMAMAVAACAGEEEAPPATTVETLPSRASDAPPPTEPLDPLATTTTTSPPARVPKDVNACRLLGRRRLARILKEDATNGARLDAIDDQQEQDEGAGPTTTTTIAGIGAAGTPGRLYLSTCAWPDADDQRLRLTYVAPRSTPSALEHLTRVIEAGGGFAGDARAVPLNPIDGIAPAALIAPDNTVIEVAAVDGAALVYLEPPAGVAASTPEAQILVDLVITAIERAPR